MIDQNTIGRIFDSADIVDVVSDFVSLKKRGTNYLGLCPFHKEKTPSFMVSPAKGIYKCFGCGKGGNPVNFVMEHEQLDYPAALRYLAKKYNIEIQEREESPEEKKVKDERESLLIVSDYAKKFFVKQLHNTNEGQNIGLSYFRERGFTDEIITKFELGYSPEKRDEFTQTAVTAGYKLNYLDACGLSIVRDNYKADRFWGRVIFPIHNMAGRVIAFGGRVLRNDKKTAKYLNSPESIIYHKSNVLYGIFQAKRAITQEDKCYLVEGYTDVLAMHQAGIENVVASSGTALTENQIRLIKRFTNNLTILYDGDPAGIKASLRGIDLVLQQDINVKVMLLPNGEDPDSFAKSRSEEVLRAHIAQHETDFIRFKADLLLTDVKDAVARAQAINDIVRSIAKIEDEIKRQVFIKETYQLLGIDERRLAFQVNNIIQVDQQKAQKREKNKSQQHAAQPEEPPEFVPDDMQLTRRDVVEHQLVSILLKHANALLPAEAEGEDQLKVAEHIVFELEDDNIEFSHWVCKKIFDVYQQHIEDAELPTAEFFTRHSDLTVQKLSVDLISREYPLSQFWKTVAKNTPDEEINLKKGISKIVLEYKNLWVTEEYQKLQDQLRTAPPPEKQLEILQQLHALQHVRSVITEKIGRIMG